jgi:hypothetical protein
MILDVYIKSWQLKSSTPSVSLYLSLKTKGVLDFDCYDFM